jgi:hypothetical protein
MILSILPGADIILSSWRLVKKKTLVWDWDKDENR